MKMDAAYFIKKFEAIGIKRTMPAVHLDIVDAQPTTEKPQNPARSKIFCRLAQLQSMMVRGLQQ